MKIEYLYVNLMHAKILCIFVINIHGLSKDSKTILTTEYLVFDGLKISKIKKLLCIDTESFIR